MSTIYHQQSINNQQSFQDAAIHIWDIESNGDYHVGGYDRVPHHIDIAGTMHISPPPPQCERSTSHANDGASDGHHNNDDDHKDKDKDNDNDNDNHQYCKVVVIGAGHDVHIWNLHGIIGVHYDCDY